MREKQGSSENDWRGETPNESIKKQKKELDWSCVERWWVNEGRPRTAMKILSRVENRDAMDPSGDKTLEKKNGLYPLVIW